MLYRLSYFRVAPLGDHWVGADGFEPPKSKTADLQSAPFGHSGTHPFIKDHFPSFLSGAPANFNLWGERCTIRSVIERQGRESREY